MLGITVTWHVLCHDRDMSVSLPRELESRRQAEDIPGAQAIEKLQSLSGLVVSAIHVAFLACRTAASPPRSALTVVTGIERLWIDVLHDDEGRRIYQSLGMDGERVGGSTRNCWVADDAELFVTELENGAVYPLTDVRA